MKWYKVKAIKDFIWTNGVEKVIVSKNETIEVDEEAKKQLVDEEMLCEEVKS